MMRSHDDSMLELAALRGIDALEAHDAAIIDDHMAECADCRAEFARSRSAGTALAFSAASPPPPSLRARVLASAVKIRRIHPWYRQLTVQAGLAAAIALIVAGSWFATHRPAPSLQAVAKCTATGLDCGTVVATSGVVRLDARGLSAPPAGKTYQAWLIHPNAKPVPEPTFSVSASGEGQVAMSAQAVKGDVVAVTVEPVGGSQAPTTKPLLVATL